MSEQEEYCKKQWNGNDDVVAELSERSIDWILFSILANESGHRSLSYPKVIRLVQLLTVGFGQHQHLITGPVAHDVRRVAA